MEWIRMTASCGRQNMSYGRWGSSSCVMVRRTSSRTGLPSGVRAAVWQVTSTPTGDLGGALQGVNNAPFVHTSAHNLLRT